MLDDGIHNTRTLGHSTQLEEAFADNAESEEQQCCPQQCVPNPQPQCS